MKDPLNTFFKYLGFVVVQLALASCIFNNSKENQQGALHFRISIESRSYFHQIADSAFVTVTGMDMHTVKIPLTIDDSILTGVVADVPSGKKKNF